MSFLCGNILTNTWRPHFCQQNGHEFILMYVSLIIGEWIWIFLNILISFGVSFSNYLFIFIGHLKIVSYIFLVNLWEFLLYYWYYPQFILDVAFLFSHSASCKYTLWYSALNRNLQFSCRHHLFHLMSLECEC